MSLGDAFIRGMFIGEVMKSRAHADVASDWKKVAEQLDDNMLKANAKIIDVASARDAFKSCLTEVVLELKEVKPRRLSLPYADAERMEHMKAVKRQSQAKLEAEADLDGVGYSDAAKSRNRFRR
jgi:hypothetical protein